MNAGNTREGLSWFLSLLPHSAGGNLICREKEAMRILRHTCNSFTNIDTDTFVNHPSVGNAWPVLDTWRHGHGRPNGLVPAQWDLLQTIGTSIIGQASEVVAFDFTGVHSGLHLWLFVTPPIGDEMTIRLPILAY